MTDRVARGTQPPITPHDDALNEFVQEIKALYDLSDADELRLLDTVGNFVNIVAVNALAARPRAHEPKVLIPQGLGEGPEIMRPDEVSQALGIPVSTLSLMRRKYGGPAFWHTGRSVFYNRVDVKEWLAGRGTAPATNGPVRDSLGVVDAPKAADDPRELRS